MNKESFSTALEAISVWNRMDATATCVPDIVL